MLKYSHPTLAWILDHWPITIFMPAILLLIAVLALITRWWDQRDEEARQSARRAVAAGGVVVDWEAGRQHKPAAPGAPWPGRPVSGNARGGRQAS